MFRKTTPLICFSKASAGYSPYAALTSVRDWSVPVNGLAPCWARNSARAGMACSGACGVASHTIDVRNADVKPDRARKCRRGMHTSRNCRINSCANPTLASSASIHKFDTAEAISAS